MVNWPDLHGGAFEGQRVLITGGAGFIGSHLARALGVLGAEVVALDDLTAGAWENLAGCAGRVEQFAASILDAEALARACRGCRWVFHEAALGSVPRSLEEPERYFQVNVMGTLAVLQAAQAAGVQRVIYAGSSSAYGDPPVEGAKVEEMELLPRSPYAATKLAGEHAARAWAHSFGLDTAVLRYFNIFGPRQSPSGAYAAVIAAFARALLGGEGGQIYGDGTQSRDFTHVANAVHANLLAARHPGPLAGGVFNVACGQSVSVADLHRRMAELLGRPQLTPHHDGARPGDVLHSLADISKARRTLGYEVVAEFEEGLADTVKWYRESLIQE